MHLFRMESLHQFSIGLAGERSPAAALERCVAWLAAAPGTCLARLWLCEGPRLRQAASAGAPHGDHPGDPGEAFGLAPPAEGILGRLVTTREPLRIENPQGDPSWRAHRDWARGEGVVGFGAAPLLARGDCLGVVAVFRRRPVDRPALASLVTVAAHTAAALERGRAFADLERRRRALDAENTWLRSAVLESAQVQTAASILTENQMRDLERANTRAALERCRGKLYGKDGAARLLGLNPTTLASRIRKFQLVPAAPVLGARP